MGKRNKFKLEDLFDNMTRQLGLGTLPEYKKFNLGSGLIVAVFILLITAQPVLALIDNILITIGNILITIFSDRPLLPRHNESVVISMLTSGLIIVFELTLCKIYCLFAQKINKH